MLVNLLRKKEGKNSQDLEEDILDEDLDKELEELEDLAKEGAEEEELDEEDEEEEEEEKRPFKAALWEIIKDVIIAFIIVIIIIGGIYIYTGNWPPVVVVESDSMQHSDDESKLGVIDTGDLVLVKSVDGANDVVSYMKGERIGHETYGESGDVLIYQKNGYGDTTPVIHRAIVYLKYNETSNSFDIPELKYKHHKVPDDWYVEGGETRWYALTGSVVLKDIGYDHIDVKINLRAILDNFANNDIEPHSGFITLGDHNDARYDQANLNDEHGGIVRPVRPEWVVGKARGELPWFGAIKLYLTDDNPDDGQGREAVPGNSWTWLIISIVLIFAVPICIDITLILLDRRRERLEREEEEEEGEEEEEEEEGVDEEEEWEEEEGMDEEEEEDMDEELDFDEDELPPPND